MEWQVVLKGEALERDRRVRDWEEKMAWMKEEETSE